MMPITHVASTQPRARTRATQIRVKMARALMTERDLLVAAIADIQEVLAVNILFLDAKNLMAKKRIKRFTDKLFKKFV